jgi:hypothetical protein
MVNIELGLNGVIEWLTIFNHYWSKLENKSQTNLC